MNEIFEIDLIFWVANNTTDSTVIVQQVYTNSSIWRLQLHSTHLYQPIRGAPDRLFYYPAGAGFGRIVKYDIRPEPDNVNLSSYIIWISFNFLLKQKAKQS